MALETSCVRSKPADDGMPPMNGSMSSHTSRLPLPSECETMISRSGRTFGSKRSLRKALSPTGRRLGPGLASTINENEKPNGRS